MADRDLDYVDLVCGRNENGALIRPRSEDRVEVLKKQRIADAFAAAVEGDDATRREAIEMVASRIVELEVRIAKLEGTLRGIRMAAAIYPHSTFAAAVVQVADEALEAK